MSKAILGNVSQRVGLGLACPFIWPAFCGPLVTLSQGKSLRRITGLWSQADLTLLLGSPQVHTRPWACLFLAGSGQDCGEVVAAKEERLLESTAVVIIIVAHSDQMLTTYQGLFPGGRVAGFMWINGGRRDSMTCPHHRAMKPGRKDSNPSHLAPELAILEGQCLSGIFEGWGHPLDTSWAALGTLPSHLFSWSFTLCSGEKPTSALTSFHSVQNNRVCFSSPKGRECHSSPWSHRQKAGTASALLVSVL